MKIDRFVKVMLVLIVVFLALNFFNNFNNSFNSQGDRFRFENIAEAQVANRANKPAANTSVSASRTQYKAVYGPDTMYSGQIVRSAKYAKLGVCGDIRQRLDIQEVMSF